MKKNKTLRQLVDKSVLLLIYVCAASTAFILIGMIGYISYKGLYRETTSINRIIDSNNIIFELDNEEYTLIVDKKIKRNSLNITEIHEILNRDVKNWSSISESRAGINFVSLVNNNIDSKYEITDVSNAETFKKYLLTESGTIGFVKPDLIEKINMKGLKVLNINKQCVIAGYKVSEIINNKKLSVINENDLKKIIKGDIDNWKQLGGHDIKL